MNKTHLISVGKLKEKYLKDAVSEYTKRLGRFSQVTLTVLADEKIHDNYSPTQLEQVKKAEGDKILRVTDKLGDYNIFPLSPGGQMLDSLAFAKLLAQNPKQVFVIGGTLGLSEAVLKLGKPLSFSPMTFSHQIIPVMLLEQLFRGYKINAGQQYHR